MGPQLQVSKASFCHVRVVTGWAACGTQLRNARNRQLSREIICHVRIVTGRAAGAKTAKKSTGPPAN